jgi:hypothetical protein
MADWHRQGNRARRGFGRRSARMAINLFGKGGGKGGDGTGGMPPD